MLLLREPGAGLVHLFGQGRDLFVRRAQFVLQVIVLRAGVFQPGFQLTDFCLHLFQALAVTFFIRMGTESSAQQDGKQGDGAQCHPFNVFRSGYWSVCKRKQGMSGHFLRLFNAHDIKQGR